MIVNWTATDECGNVTNQAQALVIIRPQLSDIVKTENVLLSCDGNNGKDIVTAVPSIKIGKLKNGVLVPSDTIDLSEQDYVCGYILQRRDIFVPATDCGKKTFVTWSILDWCDRNSAPRRIGTQAVTITDTLAPTFIN